MDDFDNLNSKTDSDLRQIAVAFGDFTPEEAESKTRDELIMAITGAKDIGDVTVVDLAEDPVPLKPVSIPEPVSSTENMKSLDELIVDVGRTARFETNELADAILKAERAEEKNVAKKETVAEEKPAEITEAAVEESRLIRKQRRRQRRSLPEARKRLRQRLRNRLLKNRKRLPSKQPLKLKRRRIRSLPVRRKRPEAAGKKMMLLPL